jgi:plasmid stability protein
MGEKRPTTNAQQVFISTLTFCLHISYRSDVIRRGKRRGCFMIAQMTLRHIPDEVGKSLRMRAKKSGRSMNRAAIELLEVALEIRPREFKRRDLSRFAGQWNTEECRTFERNTRVFDQIDPEVWPK